MDEIIKPKIMKELTKEQKIELYDLIYPTSLENDDDIKANTITAT